MVFQLFGLGLVLWGLSSKKEEKPVQTTQKRIMKFGDPKHNEKVEQIAREINVPSEWLFGIMTFETAGTLSPYSKNNLGFGGLIGFGPVYGNGKYIDGTYSLDNLFKIGISGQLDYVRKYFLDAQRQYGRFKSKIDIYLAVFHPLSIPHSNKNNHIVGTERNKDWAAAVARDNPVFRDAKANGYVTIGKIKEKLSLFF